MSILYVKNNFPMYLLNVVDKKKIAQKKKLLQN